MAHTVASGLSSGKNRLKLTDFVLRWRRRRSQTPAQQLEVLRAFAARQEGNSVHNR